MGAVTGGTVLPAFTVVHDDPDGEAADTIRIWRGTKHSGGLWAEIVKTVTGINTCAYTDDHLMSDREYFYFAELRQKDGQWIVTSPIWYTLSATLGIDGQPAAVVSVYYDTVNKQLHCALDRAHAAEVQVSDVQGRSVARKKVTGGSALLDVSELAPGLYFVRVDASQYAVVRKVFVH
jgi:hypothetical protein